MGKKRIMPCRESFGKEISEAAIWIDAFGGKKAVGDFLKSYEIPEKVRLGQRKGEKVDG